MVSSSRLSNGLTLRGLLRRVESESRHGIRTSTTSDSAVNDLELRELLQQVGCALYGERWQVPTAELLGTDPRLLRRWISGERDVSLAALPLLLAEVHRRLTTTLPDLKTRLEAAILAAPVPLNTSRRPRRPRQTTSRLKTVAPSGEP